MQNTHSSSKSCFTVNSVLGRLDGLTLSFNTQNRETTQRRRRKKNKQTDVTLRRLLLLLTPFLNSGVGENVFADPSRQDYPSFGCYRNVFLLF